MRYLKLTKSKGRLIGAAVLCMLTIALGIAIPGTLRSNLEGAPLLLYIVPVFLVIVLCALLLETENMPSRVLAIFKGLAALLCVLMILYTVEMLCSVNLADIVRTKPAHAGLECLVLVAVTSLFFSLTGRLPWALRLTAIVCAVYGYVSYFTLAFRGTMFIAQDISAARTALEVLPNYALTITGNLAQSVLVFVGVWLLAGTTRHGKLRGAGGGIVRAVALLLSVAYGVLTLTPGFMMRFDLRPHYWSQAVSAQENGAVLNFLAGITDSRTSKPDGYSAQAVGYITGRYSSDSAADTGEKPDIILILGESWANLVIDGYAQTNIPVTPFMDSFRDREDGIFRNLIVANPGGGTATSEFEILTGASKIFGLHDGAPLQFNVTSPIPTIASNLKLLGYDTTAMHTGTATAWSRDKALPLMGFDQFWAETDIETERSKKLRYYLSDEAMYDKTLQLLDAADGPQFVYLNTIQTHGGYETATYESPIVIEQPQGDFKKTEQYLGLLHESDKDLQAFVEALGQRDKPTILLAFGDHTPLVDEAYINQVVRPMDEEFGGMNVSDYMTYYIMWANFPLPDVVRNQPPYVGTNTLGVYLHLAADLPMTGFQKFLLEGNQEFPVTSYVGFINPAGEYTPLNLVWETTFYWEHQVVQYNLVMDKAHMDTPFFTLAE